MSGCRAAMIRHDSLSCALLLGSQPLGPHSSRPPCWVVRRPLLGDDCGWSFSQIALGRVSNFPIRLCCDTETGLWWHAASFGDVSSRRGRTVRCRRGETARGMKARYNQRIRSWLKWHGLSPIPPLRSMAVAHLPFGRSPLRISGRVKLPRRRQASSLVARRIPCFGSPG